MGSVRPITEEDVPAVLNLHQRVLGKSGGQSGAARREKAFRELYICSPMQNSLIRPLVYQERDGRIAGFLGVLMRPLSYKGKTFQCAVSAHFCVDPASRGFAGAQLLTAYMEGPQDLSIADEANDTTRKLWHWFGGDVVLLRSLSWTLPLRPFRLGLQFTAKRAPNVARALPLLRPLASMAEGLTSWSHASLRAPAAGLIGEPLDAETMLQCQAEFRDAGTLQPCYTAESLKWILDRVASHPSKGPLRKVLVRGPEGRVAGWYLYCVRKGEIGQVLQVISRPQDTGAVLQHLAHDASTQGAIAVTGALDANLYQAVLNRLSFIRHNCWMLVHSKHHELLDAFHQGKAQLTRLEGEWSQHLE